jgi:hypothetical protein
VSDATAESGGQDEELFRAYLGARIDQAAAALEHQRATLATDPKNFDKAFKVMRALRDMQALRAELATYTVPAPNATDMAEAEEAPAIGSAEPGEAFRATQAAKAARIMEQFEGTATKQCPKCRQVLPVSTALCLCGFAFRRDRGGDRIPALSDGETPTSADAPHDNQR